MNMVGFAGAINRTERFLTLGKRLLNKIRDFRAGKWFNLMSARFLGGCRLFVVLLDLGCDANVLNGCSRSGSTCFGLLRYVTGKMEESLGAFFCNVIVCCPR